MESTIWKQAANNFNKLIKMLNEKPKEDNESRPKLVENIELDNTSIFSSEDLLMYKGVVEFYTKEYSAALTVLYYIPIGL